MLACGENANQLAHAVEAVVSISRAPVIGVRTKSDLSKVIPSDVALISSEAAVIPGKASDLQFVSAETGEGLKELLGAIARCLSENAGALQLDAPILTRARQRVAIEKAREELTLFRETFASRAAPAVVAAVHLRDATRVLEELIGSVDVEDVLDRLFSRFCIGK